MKSKHDKSGSSGDKYDAKDDDNSFSDNEGNRSRSTSRNERKGGGKCLASKMSSILDLIALNFSN